MELDVLPADFSADPDADFSLEPSDEPPPEEPDEEVEPVVPLDPLAPPVLALPDSRLSVR